MSLRIVSDFFVCRVDIEADRVTMAAPIVGPEPGWAASGLDREATVSRRRQYSLNPRNAHGLSPASVTRQSDEVAWTDEERERYWAEMQRLQAERPHADPEPE